MFLLAVLCLLLESSTGDTGTQRFTALRFNYDRNSYISFYPDMSPMTQSFSVCLWIRKLQPGHGQAPFGYSGNEILMLDSGILIRLFSSLDARLTSKFTTPQGSWYFYCSTWSLASRTNRIYHNGELIGTQTTPSGRTLQTGRTLVLGNHSPGTVHHFGGEMYNFNMFSRELTASEVASLSENGLCTLIPESLEDYRKIKWEEILKLSRTGTVKDYTLLNCFPAIIDLKSQLNRTLEDLVEVQGKFNSSQEELSAARGQIGTLREELNNTKTELEETKIELEETKTELEETKTELEETKTELEETKTELEETKTEMEETKTELEETKTEMEETKTELEETKTEMEETKTELEETKTEMEETKTELEETKTEMEETKIELEETKTELEETKTELEETKTELEETKTEMEETKTELEETKTEMEETKTELEETKTEMEETKTELEETKTEMEETKTELEETKTEMEETKIELEETKEDLTNVTQSKCVLQRGNLTKWDVFYSPDYYNKTFTRQLYRQLQSTWNTISSKNFVTCFLY